MPESTIDSFQSTIVSMLIGYNTNGFAHHRIEDAISIFAGIGYASVAITVDHDLLDPPNRSGFAAAAARIRPMLERNNLHVTIETGARFILDPKRKHHPTLISASPSDRERRIEYLRACIDLATAIDADSVSLWSGAADDPVVRLITPSPWQGEGWGEGRTPAKHPSPDLSPRGERSFKMQSGEDERVLLDRLEASLREILDYARRAGVRLSFEPEPGMFIDTMDKFDALERRLNDPQFGLTLDVGHVHCLGDGDAANHIRQWREKLWNLHIEDMRRGVHEHLMFGDGDMDFPPIFAALRETEYAGPVHVELSRHSHDAVETARRSFEFLRQFA